MMSVINRRDGMVDKHNFNFSNIIDNRIGPTKNRRTTSGSTRGKTEWYTPISLTNKARIADTVLEPIIRHIKSIPI